MMTPPNHPHRTHPHAGEALLGADDQRGQDLGAHDVADSHEGDETGARTRDSRDSRWVKVSSIGKCILYAYFDLGDELANIGINPRAPVIYVMQTS